jgi:Na+-transporting NADH:ubiquinone oxidoreductase subunit F
MSVFTLLVCCLAALVLLVRRRLEPELDVQVTVNGQQVFTATTGDRLLWQLADEGVYLPAACGGRGACGQCRVIVEDGGGPVLPNEYAHITGPELRSGVRLACMVTVREALSVVLPPGTLEARRWQARVREIRHISTFLREIVFDLDDTIAFRAGDYVLVEAPPGRIAYTGIDLAEEVATEWQRLGLTHLVAEISEPTLRAYSLANPPAEDRSIRLVVRIATPPLHAPDGVAPGKVSSYLFSLKVGDQAILSGPFGDFHIQPGEREMIFIGGGAGIAPINSMITDLLETRRSLQTISFWYGARNVRELVFRKRLEYLAGQHANFRYVAALSAPEPDDRWDGPTGLVHRVVYDQYLSTHPHPEEAEYYLCGPPLMTGAVLAMLDDLGVDRESVHLDDFGG